MTNEISIPFYISYVMLWALVIFQSLLLLGLVRIVHDLQRNGATVGLSEGQEAPEFNVVSVSGAPIRTADFAGRITALLFVSPTCGACDDALRDIDYLRYKTNQGNVIVVSHSGREDGLRLVEKYKLTVPIIADVEDQLSRLYRVSSVPTAVIIANNRIKSYGQVKPAEKSDQSLPQAEEVQLQAAG